MRQFRWPTPQRFNIGRAVCERHAPDTLAMIVENADGSAIIIHAGPDDYKTDPTGNAGKRVYCGVFTRG